VRPRITAQDNTVPAPRLVQFVGFARAGGLLAADREVEMTLLANPGQPAEIQARCRLPNTLLVPRAPPAEASLPLDLLQAKFSSHVVFADGLENPPFSYFGGSVLEAKCGGQSRRALSLHPPPTGRSLADWWLKLPATTARLQTAIGIRDGAKGQGVGFAIEVNGRKVFSQTVKPDAGWVRVEINLAEWQGQTVALTLVTESVGDGQSAWAVWAEPRLVSER
jgi:hypothetical protein